MQGSAAETHKEIVSRSLTCTRESMTQLKEGLSWYWILDNEDAEAAQQMVDDIDNLIRRIKQHERK